MKLLVVFALVACCYSRPDPEPIPEVYGYLTNYGIPAAERLRKAEEEFLADKNSRITGGQASSLGQFPWQAGIVISLAGVDNLALCGGSLLNNRRVLTAAHCWFDGVSQAIRFTIVLGSITIFSGGVRINTSTIQSHPSFSVLLASNDIAVAYLPNNVSFNANIAPIPLPAGDELNENFAGVTAVASGFGLIGDNVSIGPNQFLSHVSLPVITNAECLQAYPLHVQPTNVCTSGAGGRGTCRGDSGGPLMVTRGNRTILIGVTSFGWPLGCQAGQPAAYARVTSFMAFINQNL